MWPEPSPTPTPPTPRLRDSRVVRASLGIALAAALVSVVLVGALVAAEHFSAQLQVGTNRAVAAISALVVLGEVLDVCRHLLRWGFQRPPASTLPARTPLTWTPPPPPQTPDPTPLAPVVPLRRPTRRSDRTPDEVRRVQAALILGPQAVPSPAPAPTPRPSRRDREPRQHRHHEVPRRPRREPRPARQPKGLMVGWSHAEHGDRVAMWLRGPAAGTEVVEGDDLDTVEVEVDGRLREAVVRGQHLEIVTGRELRALARAWAEQKGEGR